MSRLARLTASVLVAVVAIPAIGTSVATASPIDDQRARVEQLADQLEVLEERSDILAEDYVDALAEQQRLEGEVDAAERRVAKREAQVAEVRKELAAVAVQSFVGSGSNGLGPMFSDSSTVNDELQRDQLSRVALEAGTATTDELDELVTDLNEERAALEAKRDEATAVAEQVDAAKQATDEQKAEYEQLRQSAEVELGQMLREEEERRQRESYERMLREAREAAERAQQPQTGDDGIDNGGGGGDSPAPVPDPGSDPAPSPDPDPAPPSNPVIPPASSRAGVAINAAKTQLGVPYRYAAATPGVAFDCSGLTSWAWGQAGVYLPHQSRQQYASVAHVPTGSAAPGDLIFYYSPISHVGIYLGGGMMVHAPNSGTVVQISGVSWDKVTGVGRPG